MDSSGKFTRRTLLQVASVGLGTAALGSSLAGCSSSGASGSKGLTLATVSEFDSTVPFLNAQLAEFTRQTGVPVKLLTYPSAQYENAVQLLFAGDSPPDVFRMGGLSVAHPTAWIKGWEHSIQKDVTADFQGRFPFSFDCNTSGLCAGPETFSTPYLSKVTLLPLLFFNVDLLKKYAQADQPPATWGELEQVAAAVTRASGGSVYGFGAFGQSGGRGLVTAMNGLHATAGPRHDLINYQTGRPGLSSPNTVAAVKLLRSMHAAGSMPPGWENWHDTNLWSNFAAGRVAMYIGSNSEYATIQSLAKGLNFDFATVPVPDGGRKAFNTTFGPYAPYWAMGAKTQKESDAWKLMDFFGSTAHQRALYTSNEKLVPAIKSQAYEDLLSDRAKKMLTLSTSSSRRGPDPIARNPYAAQVQGALVANQPKPTSSEIVTSAVLEGTDFASAAAKFDQALGKVFDEQIAKAGHGLTADDFKFSNWDPMSDYVA